MAVFAVRILIMLNVGINESKKLMDSTKYNLMQT